MRKIWIVDDDEEMTQAIKLMLGVIQCIGESFLTSRAAAQALLSGTEPDLVLLDINMPDISGLDLLEFIRRRPQWHDLPIVMLSTEAADVTVDKALQLGADGYITKPVTTEELERTIDLAMRKHGKGLG